MAKTTQLVLSLKSKPGVLAGISRALSDARVNILSLSAAEVKGRGKIRMTVSNPVVAKRALRKARVRFVEEVAFAKRLRNKPGALARVVEKLARGRVNIRSAYATTTGRGGATVILQDLRFLPFFTGPWEPDQTQGIRRQPFVYRVRLDTALRAVERGFVRGGRR